MPVDRFLGRIMSFALAVGLTLEVVVDRHALGVNVPIVVAAFLAAAFATRPRHRYVDALDLWLAPAAMVFAAFVAIRADRALVIIDLAAVVILVGASVAALAGAAVTRRTLAAGLFLAAQIAAAAGAGALAVEERLRASGRLSGVASRRVVRLAPVARGLAIGLPLVLVFTLLFMAADPIFGSLVRGAFSLDFDAGDLAARAAVVLVTAWVVAGLLWLVAVGDAGLEARSLGAAASAPSMPMPRLGATEALTVLVALDLLFATFVVLQVAYLFGGLDTLAAGGLTYANYARRGFFELLAVVFLVGGLVGGFEAVIASRPRAYVAAMLTLVGLTAVVLASSYLRLRLYQDAYGWTELRFYVLASIGFLAIALAAAAWLVARNGSRWLPHAVSAAGVGVLLAINVVGPQAFATDRNLDRARDPSLVSEGGRVALDTEYLSTLQADAVPALVAALPDLTPLSRVQVLASLRQLGDRLDREAPAGDPVAWNRSRELAREALTALPPR